MRKISVCLIVLFSFLSVNNALDKEKIKKDNLNLIKENIINFEEIDFKKIELNKDDVVNKEDIKNVLYLTYNKDDDRKWKIFSIGKVSAVNKISTSDLDNVDVIAISVSSYISKTYKCVSGCVGTPTIKSERVDLFYINPKTKTIFKKDFIDSKPLPKTTNSSHDYKKSVYDIERKIKSDLGMFLLPSFLEILLYILGGVAFFVILLLPFIFIIKKIK